MYYIKDKECHYGTIEVFTDPKSGIKVSAGGDTRGLEVKKGSILLLLAKHIDIPQVKMSNFFSEELNRYNYPTIELEWTDYKAAPYGRDFWKTLVEVLREEKKDVIVACMGGHGRTGTCLSILGVLMKAIPKGKDPVEWIRNKYCKKAVESEAQIRYIEDITGVKVKADPYKAYRFNTRFDSKFDYDYSDRSTHKTRKKKDRQKKSKTDSKGAVSKKIYKYVGGKWVEDNFYV